MRRSVAMLLVAVEAGVLAWWFFNLQFQTGFDPMQYDRMAYAIQRNGLAPWILNPLSYAGMYPGSDSSGVPFLAASFNILAGQPLALTVLVYDATLLVVFGMGLFLLVQRTTQRADLGILSILLGTLAYGFFMAISWSLDERSFNVACAPLFLILALPAEPLAMPRLPMTKLGLLGLLSFVMVVSHSSFLLLLPFLVLPPLVYRAVRRLYAARRKWTTSLAFFGGVALFPLFFLYALNSLGVLSDYGLEYQLESSALFTGNSPFVFLANSIIFLGTRIGPLNLVFGLLGLGYLAFSRLMLPRNIAIGAFMLAGFVGLPIVLYSKDLLTPVFVLSGAVALGSLLHNPVRRRVLPCILVAVLVVSGSVAFDTWNSNRTARASDSLYWALPGVTAEAQSGNLWISTVQPVGSCAYGNNPALLQQVVTGGTATVCDGVSVDYLINSGTAAATGSLEIHIVFVGLSRVNPNNWFSSPDLTKVSDDFSNLPFLSYEAGRSVLREYHVSLVVVDLAKSTEVSGFAFESSYQSSFFAGLWDEAYPMYRSTNFVVFRMD